MANYLSFYRCLTHGKWEHLGSASDIIQMTRPCPKCRKPSEIISNA